MAVDESPPCQTCTFWDGKRCTHTWRLTVHIEPLGGQMDFSITPGMVPEHLIPELEKFVKNFMDKLAPAIRMWPIWDRVLDWQLLNHEILERCPGRQVRRDIPYLHVVKGDLDLSFENKER